MQRTESALHFSVRPLTPALDLVQFHQQRMKKPSVLCNSEGSVIWWWTAELNRRPPSGPDMKAGDLRVPICMKRAFC